MREEANASHGGTRMLEEMGEQPHVIASLLERRNQIATEIASVLPRPLAGVVLVARGSSDNAAVFGRYVIQVAARRPVALAAPSLHTMYPSTIDCSGYLCVGISQSGETPDVVDTLAALSRAGGRSIAVTNATESPLSDVAELTVDLDAGPEVAVPATKTFTASLVALALIAAAVGPVPWSSEDLQRAVTAVTTVLDDGRSVHAAASSIVPAPGLIVAGRGWAYSAVLETALKVRETSALFAEGYSTADLRHGPVAAIGEGTPVLLLWAGAAGKGDARDLEQVLRARCPALLTISDDPTADLVVPQVAEELGAIPLVVRGQQLAHSLATLLGLDPDAPMGLTKVTYP